MIDEWDIPYDDIRLLDMLTRGPVVEVYRGYWHGEVAIKKFILPDATPEQIEKFKDEVSILKKTRHENLALFMGASLTPPNLAIVTRYVCTVPRAYKEERACNTTSTVIQGARIAIYSISGLSIQFLLARKTNSQLHALF